VKIFLDILSSSILSRWPSQTYPLPLYPFYYIFCFDLFYRCLKTCFELCFLSMILKGFCLNECTILTVDFKCVCCLWAVS
jgi:hypothetical protein